MTRKEFMQRLESLLLDLPDSERREAIQYYNDYFDDAGPENEAKVIQNRYRETQNLSAACVFRPAI